MKVTTPPATDELFGLLAGDLAKFQLFSQEAETDWLLDLAHNICDPRHRSGTLKMRLTPSHPWQSTVAGQILTAADYLYDTMTVTLGLMRINRRKNKSRRRNSESASGAPGSMQAAVIARDTRCWISQSSGRLVNSHIIPTRMGDALATRILEDFSFSPAKVNFATQVSVFDPRLGLTLSRNNNALFAFYSLGFRARATNAHDYTVHVFDDPSTGNVYVTSGDCVKMPTDQPLLHNTLASPPDPTAHNLPYRAALAWHYTQCVVEKFGHYDYKTLSNIVAPCGRPVRPLPNEDEDRDSDPDDEPN
ncbi:hypothetical protein BKA62DRAFT_708893 [Auriculariales sp. MPI-PUGE-AT-0066]|nr:hypothetical protein BKA62DRAFT_708893 [Auriculariales sp. MPI-PUGE-AT-0066]